jgi:hypothetical protein
MADGLSERYGGLLRGSYDCVDRVVLNAYYPLGHSPGGFRTWWRRWHDGSDDDLDNEHLMRVAGRFARRVRGWAKANGVEVVSCDTGERKHRIAEEYLARHRVATGVFLILVARAPATVWDVARTKKGNIANLKKKEKAFVNHYSFHIMDPVFGHVTIKMSGHPPFAAQVILNGHDYVAAQAVRSRIDYTKEGNCFTATSDPQAWPGWQTPFRHYRSQGCWARSAIGGSTPPVSASGWTSPTKNAAGSPTATPSTRSSTAAT